MTTNILFRRSQTNKETNSRWIHLSKRTQLALLEWIHQLNEDKGQKFRGVNRGNNIYQSIGSSQINRIYKKVAKIGGIESDLVKKISGHYMRLGCAQDLVNLGASLPIIISMGRCTRADAIMK